MLHPLDVIDDLGRAYGFNDLEPKYPDVGTVGGRHERSRLEDAVRTQLVGLGFEDLLNFHMISEAENFDRLEIAPDDDVYGAGDPPTIKGPYSEDYTMLRTWVTPSLLMVLERNTHRAYPQDLAEIGFTAAVDDSENTGVAERRRVGPSSPATRPATRTPRPASRHSRGGSTSISRRRRRTTQPTFRAERRAS